MGCGSKMRWVGTWLEDLEWRIGKGREVEEGRAGGAGTVEMKCNYKRSDAGTLPPGFGSWRIYWLEE
jgi:hypothetical protein